MTRLSLEAAFAQTDDVQVSAPCDGCGIVTPAWALYEAQEGEPDGWVCGSCIRDVARIAPMLIEASSVIPKEDWESEWGIYLKSERNRLLNDTMWTVGPGSPLSLDCQDLFTNYRNALNRMTLDYPTTDLWTWPEVPALAYPA